MLYKCKRSGCKNRFSRKGIGKGRKLYCSEECADFMRNQRWRLKHPDKRRQYLNEWQEQNLPFLMFWTAKGRASKKHLDFDIDVSDVIIPEFCPVLGIRLETKRNKATRFTTSPSLDRIDSTKGYVKGNVRVISARANCLKNNATVEELEMVLADLRAITGGSHG
jgi:hypothetical protein